MRPGTFRIELQPSLSCSIGLIDIGIVLVSLININAGILKTKSHKADKIIVPRTGPASSQVSAKGGFLV